MNLLFFNDIPFNPYYGGIERVTDMIVRELLKRGGYEITYLCEKVKEQSIMEYDYPVKLVTLPYEGGFRNHANITFYTQFINDFHIDIVVNQRGWASTMNPVIDANLVKTISVIHTIPNGWKIFMSNGLFRHNKTLDGYGRFAAKIILYPFYRLYKEYVFNKHMENHYHELLSKSSAVVVLSNRYISALRKFAGSVCCPIYSIPNPSPFRAEYVDGKEKIILYVGRLTDREKKPMRMIKIWEKLYMNHPDWSLLIVGDGDEREKMERYVRQRGLERVSFEGQQENVEKYYRKATFVCLTSQFEGWGMALTEGMSYGCIPVTFCNYGAAYDIVDDNINGCLISAYDLDEYSARLSELMENPVKRKALSISALEKSQQFSLENVVNIWESLFADVYKMPCRKFQ